MKFIYRTSESGYNKVKPEYINNETCLQNFCNVFYKHINDIYVIADNCSDFTIDMIAKYIIPENIEKVSIGNGAGTFNLAFDKALEWDDDEIVYFIENDYLHVEESDKILLEGFNLGSSFISLYDHPDKYIDGVNPFVEGGGEVTKVFLTNSCHWKFTNSTTMTFAAKISTLKQYRDVFKKWTSTSHPHDFEMWIELREMGTSLITPIPGYATHGETAWLCPLINWENKIK
jgi:hypothetical protein